MALLATILALALVAEDGAPLVRGRVTDRGGRPVAGAQLAVRRANETSATVAAAADGSFAFAPLGESAGKLEASAPGFAAVERDWKSGESVEIVLERLAWSDQVTVTAGRESLRLGDTAARAVVLDQEALRGTAAVTLDDALRQVPGFTLFRRTGSRAANPTAQGASLRGVGPSGASRTLVLLDGVPLNDGFGGWVYWSRVPRLALERVELVEGGASDLYGSGALAGAIQGLVRNDPALSVELAAGEAGDQQASLYAARRRGRWGARLVAEAFRTDGYYLLDEPTRGAVDTPADSSHLNGALRIDRRSGGSLVFLQGAAFGESRNNGTALQTNDTDWQQATAGADFRKLQVRGFYGTETYHQTFTAVAADRATEALIRTQRVPSRDAGASAQWSTSSRRNALSIGVEGRFVRGRSEETAIVAGRATTATDSGGEQASVAAFAMDRVALGSRGVLTLGARVDRWALDEASSLSTPLATGVTTTTAYADRSTTAFSPRAALLVKLGREFRLTASGYGSFRAPTLNELYRGFRVGDVQTLANAELDSERLTGGEGGLGWEKGALRARLVGFRADVRDPVANVTLRVVPGLITRQRQNLGRTRSQGLASEFEAAWSRYRLSFGYTFTDATVVSFDASPNLVGKQIAQVPRHQWTAQGRASFYGFDASAQARYGGEQFEDDLNTLTLPSYFALDARVARRFGKRLEAFVSGENVTGSRYVVALTPLESFGPPRIVRFGLRFDR